MSTRPKIIFLKAPGAAAAAGLEVDDATTGFENASLTDYYQGVGGGGTITSTSTYKKYGGLSVRLHGPSVAAYAYLRRGAFTIGGGIHRLLAHVYIVTYYGAAYGDGQDIYPYDNVNSKYTLYLALRGDGVYFGYNAVWVGAIATALSTGTWHKLMAEFDYGTPLVKAWIDDVLMGEWTPTGTLYSPTYLYFGDVSLSTLRGDFYWDTVMYGRAS